MKNLLNSKFPYADNILKGKTALVCGASKGIGKATALMLARAGAQVIICARSSEELEKLCHYTNLQPLWFEDNIKKSNKF